VHVHPESTHWFLPVTQAGVKYLAELGYYAAGGKWTTISTSQATLTPPDTMSDDMSAEFATIPTDIPFTQLMELAQAAHAMGVRKMIYTSSASVIGLQSNGSPGDEQTPPRPGVALNLYLDSKRRTEQWLREFSREKGFFIASALPSWMCRLSTHASGGVMIVLPDS